MTIPGHYKTKKALVNYTAIEALTALNATSRESAVKGIDLRNKAREMFAELTSEHQTVTDEDFRFYLTEALNSPESQICAERPWYGYYLSEAAKKLVDANAVTKECEPPSARTGNY